MMRKLLEFYKKIGAIYLHDGGVTSKNGYEICGFSAECFGPSFERNTGCDIVSLPYIGCDYFRNSKKMLIIALNGCGSSYISQTKMIHDTMFGFLENIKKIRFGNSPSDFSGTITYHRMAVYASIILSKIQNKIELDDNIENNFPMLFDSMEQVSFIESVKCSGKDVSYTMKSNCQKAFLDEEITIFDPDILLVIGKETLIMDSFEISTTIRSNNDNIIYFKCNRNNKPIEIFKVIHPTAYGGNSSDIFYELKSFLNEMYKEPL